jgi:predicted ATPase
VGLSSYTTLEEAAKNVLGETWNIPNVYVKDRTLEFEVDAALDDNGEALEFTYLLRIGAERQSAALRQPLSVIEETLKLTGGDFRQTPLIENRVGQVRLLHEKRFLSKVGELYVETSSPQDATMLSRLYDLETNRRANLFKRYLYTWLYYNFSPAALRSPRVVDKPLLGFDGANLSKVLFVLHNEKPRIERKLIESVQALEPKLDLFTFTAPDPGSVYLFLEDSNGNRFGAQSISDGTLRFLAITFLILTASSSGESEGPPPILLIEEPENGIYVGHLKPLLRAIDPSGCCGQFIFTTHSPYFIDLFDNNLEGLHFLKPGKPSSILVRPDPAIVGKMLEEMPLGEMHYREMLG